MVNNLFCFLGAHWNTNGAGYIVSTHEPGEIVAFEIEFHKLGFVFAKKTFFANIFNDADTMTGMINTITLLDSDNVLLVSKRQINKIISKNSIL